MIIIIILYVIFAILSILSIIKIFDNIHDNKKLTDLFLLFLVSYTILNILGLYVN
jgi:hypothetical protein